MYMVTRKFAFNFNFFYCFYTSVKGTFLIMELIVSFCDEIEEIQLKRFNESVIDAKC